MMPDISKNSFVSAALLIAVIGLGAALRVHHLSFPSIGYHNMKENESLGIAEEMLRTGDFRTQRVYFADAFNTGAGLKPAPALPLVSYQILLAWHFLGENLWGPRLINVIFGLMSILMAYFLARRLFSGRRSALACAFLIAVMPLTVFFSRNLQAESPAFFFMLLGNFLYVRWAQGHNDAVGARHAMLLLAAGLAMSLAWLYKPNFLIGLIPALAVSPWKELWRDKKRFAVSGAVCAASYLPVCAYLFYAVLSGRHPDNPLPFMPQVLTAGYWRTAGQAILWYARGENFTYVFGVLAACGACLAVFRRAGLVDRYLLGWLVACAAYLFIFARELPQNNFLQMPCAVCVAVAVVYALVFIAEEIKRPVKKDLFALLFIAVAAISAYPIYEALKRMYGTVFLGADVAGSTIREVTRPDERVFLKTHAQGNAVARYAQRYMGWPVSLSDFKDKEARFGARIVCLFPAENIEYLKKDAPALYAYIDAEYHVLELGFVENTRALSYIILEKGGGADNKTVSESLQSASGSLQPRAIYPLFGRLVFFYSVRPQAKQSSPLPVPPRQGEGRMVVGAGERRTMLSGTE